MVERAAINPCWEVDNLFTRLKYKCLLIILSKILANPHNRDIGLKLLIKCGLPFLGIGITRAFFQVDGYEQDSRLKL